MNILEWPRCSAPHLSFNMGGSQMFRGMFTMATSPNWATPPIGQNSYTIAIQGRLHQEGNPQDHHDQHEDQLKVSKFMKSRNLAETSFSIWVDYGRNDAQYLGRFSLNKPWVSRGCWLMMSWGFKIASSPALEASAEYVPFLQACRFDETWRSQCHHSIIHKSWQKRENSRSKNILSNFSAAGV